MMTACASAQQVQGLKPFSREGRCGNGCQAGEKLTGRRLAGLKAASPQQ
jgi:hypothetical protein